MAAWQRPAAGAVGAFGIPSLFWALPPLLEGALGLEPDRQGVEGPNPDGLLNLPLTLRGSLMLEGAPVPPSMKWFNNSYGRNERCMDRPSPPFPADNRCPIFFHLLGKKTLHRACLPSANIACTPTMCQSCVRPWGYSDNK